MSINTVDINNYWRRNSSRGGAVVDQEVREALGWSLEKADGMGEEDRIEKSLRRGFFLVTVATSLVVGKCMIVPILGHIN